jgi:recombination protein RecA
VAIFINQLREKVGVMFGNPEVTPGGRALKFYSSVRLDVRRIEAIKSGNEMLGNKTKIKIVKNKVEPPFKEVDVDIVYGKGISREGNILDVAVSLDIINRSGSWFSYNGQRIGQGRDNVKQFLIENPDICSEIESEIRAGYETSEDRHVEIVQQHEAVDRKEAKRTVDMDVEIDILSDIDD